MYGKNLTGKLPVHFDFGHQGFPFVVFLNSWD